MNKGQAAMEFLMTYGWAILVVLVAVGAMWYFGVLDPERFLPKPYNRTLEKNLMTSEQDGKALYDGYNRCLEKLSIEQLKQQRQEDLEYMERQGR